MNLVQDFLTRNWQRLELGRYGVSRTGSCILLTPRFRASSHVVFLVLAEGRPQPALVAKVPRLADGGASLAREVRNLRAIQGRRPGGFDTIPRVVAFESHCGWPILVETALVGTPVRPARRWHARRRCHEAVLAWLMQIQQPHGTGAVSDTVALERRVARPLVYLRERFPLSAEEARLLERTETLLAPLREAKVPLVFEHGDLGYPNLVWLGDGRIGVLDWELAEPQGLPALDLFFFLTQAAFAQGARSPRDYLAAFRAAFFEPAAWARASVAAYVERVPVRPCLLTPLFVACWVRYVASLLMRLEDAGGCPEPFDAETAAWVRGNRYYALWRHALDHADELDWSNL
jgi:aminoglycoside phosphotransferase